MKCHSRTIYTAQRNLHNKYDLKNEVVTAFLSTMKPYWTDVCETKPLKNSLKKGGVRKSFKILHADLVVRSWVCVLGGIEIMFCKYRSVVLILGLLHVAQGRPHRARGPGIWGVGTAQLCFVASAFLGGYIILMTVSAYHWGQEGLDHVLLCPEDPSSTGTSKIPRGWGMSYSNATGPITKKHKMRRRKIFHCNASGLETSTVICNSWLFTLVGSLPGSVPRM